MEIVYSVKNTITFDSLEVGTVFKYADEYYIKTYWMESNNRCGNALLLRDAIICSFTEKEEVIPCQAELHIIKEGNN